jgi:hypothetical protein
MVVCIVAFVVFAFLSIFSAKYRPLAKDSFKCVFRMIQFKPCEVEFEQKVRSKITAKLMRIPSLARFFYNYFKPISWIFTIAFFASLIYSAYGIYNLIRYGSCQPGATCAVNKLAETITCYETQIIAALIIIAVIVSLYFLLKKKNS